MGIYKEIIISKIKILKQQNLIKLYKPCLQYNNIFLYLIIFLKNIDKKIIRNKLKNSKEYQKDIMILSVMMKFLKKFSGEMKGIIKSETLIFENQYLLFLKIIIKLFSDNSLYMGIFF